MQSILDAINEWIKEILIGAINGNLSTMFGDVNEKVGTIEVRPCYQGIFHHSHSSAAYSFLLVLKKDDWLSVFVANFHVHLETA